MYLLIQKLPIPTPHPQAFPGIRLEFFSLQWKFGNLSSGALDFRVKILVSITSRRFCNSFHIVHNMHHDHGSLLLYSLFCWGIREPLEKPVNGVKCKLSEMNNFIELNKHL